MTKKIAEVPAASSLILKEEFGLDPDSIEQDLLDKSLTRDFEGIGVTIAGVNLRTLSLSRTMRLHEVKNEIMAGKQVKEMTNPIFAAMEFLYIMDAGNDPSAISKQVFGDRDDWRSHVTAWGEEMPMCDTLVSDVIEFINDATSSRVKARLPKAMEGDGLDPSEGNG